MRKALTKRHMRIFDKEQNIKLHKEEKRMRKSTVAIYYLAVGLLIGWFGKSVEVVRIPELIEAIKNGTLQSPSTMIDNLLYQSVLLGVVITANAAIIIYWMSKSLTNYRKRRRTSKISSKAEARAKA